MRIAFTFRNLDPSDAIKQYATDKIGKLQKFVRAPLDAELTFSVERHIHTVDVNLMCDGETHMGHEQSEDMYASIDLVADKLKKQLVRAKGAHASRRRPAEREAIGGD